MAEKSRDRSKMKKAHPGEIRDGTVSGRNESEQLSGSMNRKKKRIKIEILRKVRHNHKFSK